MCWNRSAERASERVGDHHQQTAAQSDVDERQIEMRIALLALEHEQIVVERRRRNQEDDQHERTDDGQRPTIERQAAQQLHGEADRQQRRRQRPAIVGGQHPALAEMREIADAGDQEKRAEDHPADDHQDCRCGHALPLLLESLTEMAEIIKDGMRGPPTSFFIGPPDRRD